MPAPLACPDVLVVGLTGGIGSGKSTVAEALAKRGAEIVDADLIARQVVEPGGAAYQPLVDRFGKGILRSDGTVDRQALADVAFADETATRDLNSITHPAIGGEMIERVARWADTDRVVVVDIPLLDEKRKQQWNFAGVIVVDVSVDVAVSRLVGQRGFTEADARARVEAQISRDERKKLADVVIDNSGSRAELEPQLERVWNWLEVLRTSA